MKTLEESLIKGKNIAAQKVASNVEDRVVMKGLVAPLAAAVAKFRQHKFVTSTDKRPPAI